MLDALTLAIPLFGVGIAMVALGVAARRGTLPPNGSVGIRLPSIMESEQVWDDAHKQASTWLLLTGVGPVVGAVGMLFMNNRQGAWTIFAGSWMVLFLIIATVVALRAASRFHDATGDRQPGE